MRFSCALWNLKCAKALIDVLFLHSFVQVLDRQQDFTVKSYPTRMYSCPGSILKMPMVLLGRTISGHMSLKLGKRLTAKRLKRKKVNKRK